MLGQVRRLSAVPSRMKSLSRGLTAHLPSRHQAVSITGFVRLPLRQSLRGRSFICGQYCNLRWRALLNTLAVHAPAWQPKLCRLKKQHLILPCDLRHGPFATQTSRIAPSKKSVYHFGAWLVCFAKLSATILDCLGLSRLIGG
ncbi:hypothetical protein M3J09_005530 [Ascochyta lentis]